MMNDSLLQSYHSNEGFSFGGKHLMYKNYPKINKKDIIQEKKLTFLNDE